MPRATKKAIGQRLRKLRALKGMSGAAAAKAFGLKRTTYGEYERGRNRLNWQLTWDISEFYDIPVTYLIYGVVERRPTRMVRKIEAMAPLPPETRGRRRKSKRSRRQHPR